MLYNITHCAGHISANTRPHQLRWGDMFLLAIQSFFCDVWRASTRQPIHFMQTFFVYAPTYSIIIAIIVCAELASVARHQVLFYSSIMTASYHSICYFTHTVAITLLAHMPHSLSVQSCGSVQLVHTPHSLPVEFCGSVPPPCPLDAVLVCLVLA